MATIQPPSASTQGSYPPGLPLSLAPPYTTTSTSFMLSTQVNSLGLPLKTWTVAEVPQTVIFGGPPTFAAASRTVNPTTSSTSLPRTLESSTIQSTTPTASTAPSVDLGSSASLSAGAGAGIGIGGLLLVLATIGGMTFFFRKRRRQLRARAQVEVVISGEKPQLDGTSVEPVRQELEGSRMKHMPTNGAAELRAGPYSNRHELEGRNNQMPSSLP